MYGGGAGSAPSDPSDRQVKSCIMVQQSGEEWVYYILRKGIEYYVLPYTSGTTGAVILKLGGASDNPIQSD